MVELVSDNTPNDIAANIAEGEVRFALVELTANLLRVTRGAGRPWSILDQVLKLVIAAKHYQELTGRWPDLTGVLSVDDPWGGAADHPENIATDAMLRGALQMVASRLLGQIPQEAMGSQELFVAGVHRWADAVGFRAKPPARARPSRFEQLDQKKLEDALTSDWLEREAVEEQERQRRKKLTAVQRVAERRARAEALGRVRRQKTHRKP